VNFSDRIGADRKSYKISSRRRRYRQRSASESDGSNDSEEESLPSRLARLRREAEELRIELEQRDNTDHKPDSAGLEDDFAKLNMTLEGLQAPRGHRRDSPSAPEQHPHNNDHPDTQALTPESTPSTIAAISRFADRITSLEAALPTLNHLSTQIHTLSSTLTPTPHPTSSLPTIDSLSTRIRTLTSETETLTASRRLALESLNSLTEARQRATAPAYSTHSRNPSHAAQSASAAALTSAVQQQESTLFLAEQSSKISALYELLPTIQSLHPLLPSVLDRLRSLQVVHAGAADARGDLEEVERRQGVLEGEIRKWGEGLEAVERGIKEGEEMGRGNLNVVKEMVEGLEGRLGEALK
jgi:nuclear migration protein JNM1